jgi:hypothetical protein
LAALEKFFAGKSTMREALAEVTALATVAVPQAEFAGITMTVDDTPGTWIFTHPDVQRVDRVQYDTGTGRASTHGVPVRCRRSGRPARVVHGPASARHRSSTGSSARSPSRC